MRAVATDGGGGLELVEVARPEAPGDGAVVRVEACGVCGSDLEKILDPGFPPGRVLGHEVVGRLTDGHGGGRRVAVAHHVPCGECRACRSGHSSLCTQFTQTDLDPGGFAEALAVGPRHLEDAVFWLPDEVDDLVGTLVEPLSCVLRAIDTAAGLLRGFPEPGVDRGRGRGEVPYPRAHGARGDGEDPAALAHRVAVAGCGSVGLLFLAVLAAAGRIGAPAGELRPAELLYLEPSPERAARAAELGATPLAPGEQIDLAFLTAPAAFGPLLEALRPGGVLVVFAAGREGARPSLPLDRIYRAELTLAGVRSGSPAHLRRALEILGGRRLPLDWFRPLVTDLPGLPEAVRRYAAGDVLKVVVRP